MSELLGIWKEFQHVSVWGFLVAVIGYTILRDMGIIPTKNKNNHRSERREETSNKSDDGVLHLMTIHMAKIDAIKDASHKKDQEQDVEIEKIKMYLKIKEGVDLDAKL